LIKEIKNSAGQTTGTRILGVTTIERPSPSDIVNDAIGLLTGGITKSIDGYHRIDKTLLDIPFAEDPRLWICPIPDTNSMDPLFDHGHSNLYMRGVNAPDQRLMVNWIADQWDDGMANIIVYKLTGYSVVHRLHDIQLVGHPGHEERAWWFKGDNNIRKDPHPARDSEIKWLYIGTIF